MWLQQAKIRGNNSLFWITSSIHSNHPQSTVKICLLFARSKKYLPVRRTKLIFFMTHHDWKAPKPMNIYHRFFKKAPLRGSILKAYNVLVSKISIKKRFCVNEALMAMVIGYWHLRRGDPCRNRLLMSEPMQLDPAIEPEKEVTGDISKLELGHFFPPSHCRHCTSSIGHSECHRSFYSSKSEQLCLATSHWHTCRCPDRKESRDPHIFRSCL